MSRPKILITTQMMIHEQPRFSKWLGDAGFDVEFVMNEQFLDEKVCLNLAPIYDGWIAGDDQISSKVINHLSPKLKIISKWGSGIDSIDLEHCKQNNIVVKNSPGAFADAVGEMAVAYLLALSRGVVDTHIKVRNGEWPKTQFKTLLRSKVGFVGMGHIGKAAAKRLDSIVDSICYYDPSVTINNYLNISCLDELLNISDIVILTCDLNETTYHLINSSNITLMKQNAILINVARGSLIEERALLKILKEKKIAGAALDVFENEPLPSKSPFKKFENVILGSHNANNTFDSVEFVHKNTIYNLKHFFFND